MCDDVCTKNLFLWHRQWQSGNGETFVQIDEIIVAPMNQPAVIRCGTALYTQNVFLQSITAHIDLIEYCFEVCTLRRVSRIDILAKRL